MADTVNISITANSNIVGQTAGFAKTVSLTLSSPIISVSRQQVPTGGTAEAIQKGEVGTIGYIVIVNEDATNPVTIYNQATVAGAVALCVLAAGQAAVFPASVTNLYAGATGAACNIYTQVFSAVA